MNWLALVFAAVADPADALDQATRPFWERAVQEEEAGRASRAVAFYRLVLAKDPGFVPAALGLGRALEASGAIAEAEAVYRDLSTEGDAIEALARLVEPRDPVGALELWRRLERLRIGDPTPHREQARLLAATEPAQALEAWRTYATLLEGAEPDGPTLVTLGVSLVAVGRAADAEGLWQAYIESFPAGAVAAELGARLDRMDVERAADMLALGGSTPLPAELEAARAAGVAHLAAGDAARAEEVARSLVAAVPRAAVAHGLLSDACAAQGEWSDAEVHAVLARTLAPDDAAAHLRLARLLVEGYGGRRNREAAEELREAALLRPGEPQIQYRLGVAEQSLGNWDAAISAFDAYLRAGPEGVEAVDALRRVASLRRQPPRAPEVPPAEPLRLPPGAEDHYRVTLELLRRGRTLEAVAELDAALALAPAAPILLNKRANLARQAGNADDAAELLRRSLAAAPDQGAVLLELGDMASAEGDGDGARRWYAEAAARGVADGHYQLARLAESRGDWTAVRAELAAWEAAGGGTASLHAESAAGLRQRAESRLFALRAGIALLVVAILGVPLVLWLRRRTARTLRDLLDGAPESWHDAARLLASLRHEVLKHNTTVLPDVAGALASGDEASWEAFSERAPELLTRFEATLGALQSLGRRHGVRLDLRHRDPILAPMWSAMRRLARARRPPSDLAELSEAINGTGYRQLGAIVREICVLPVTADLARAVYARVQGEPGFAGTPLPELTVEERADGLAVRMFRAELEDILANLLRNALSAGASRVGVVLADQDDPITGHGWVELRVIDDAPGTLTNAMIRGRYIGRGLGLAVDLINRHGGSIRVDALDDGRKAVSVQLPNVEAASVEVEWTG